MRAHVFDMDGTLLHQTTAPMLLAGALGGTDALAEFEQRFAAGTMTALEFSMELHAMWGIVAPEISRRVFNEAPVLENISEVLADIHARDERACLITMSPDYFAEHFLEVGFDAVFASRFPRDAETPFDGTGILQPRDKPGLAAVFCEQHGLTLDGAVAYGDSMSDVFLFREVGFRIALNADHHLDDLADVAIHGTDLLPAYQAARKLLDG